MKLALTLILSLVFILNASCSRAEPVWKSVTFYNASGDVIELKSFVGLNMYGGDGPSDFGGTTLYPRIPGTLETRVSIAVNFPITAVYRKKGSNESFKEQKILNIENLDKALVESRCAILILFRNGEFEVMYFPQDIMFTKQDLDKRYE